MAIVTFQVTGFKELSDQLREIGPRVTRNGLRSSAFAGAKKVRERVTGVITAKKLIDTGALLASISVFKRNTPPEIAKYAVGIRNVRRKFANTARNRRARRVGKAYYVPSPTFYGRFLEYGTSKMSAKPFMRPGFEGAKNDAIDAMRDGLARALARAVAKQ